MYLRIASPKDIDKVQVSTANLSIFYLTSKHFNIFLTVIRELMFIKRQWATTGGRRRAVQGGVTEERTGKANNHKKEPQEKAKRAG